MRYVVEKKPYSKTDGYNSKPKAPKVDLPKRRCIGRGYSGGGCGKMFKPKHKYNFIGKCCEHYLEKA